MDQKGKKYPPRRELPLMLIKDIFTSREAARSREGVGSSFYSWKEDFCLLSLGYYDIYAILNFIKSIIGNH